MDILNNNEWFLLAGGVLFIGLVIGLTVVVLFQQIKIRKLQQPKYGFLGKPLAPAIFSFILLTGLIGGIVLVNQEEVSGPIAEADSAAVSVVASCNASNRNDTSGELQLEVTVRIVDNQLENISASQILDDYLRNTAGPGNLQLRVELNPNSAQAPLEIRPIQLEKDNFEYTRRITFDISDLNGRYPARIVVLGILPSETGVDITESLGADLQEFSCNNLT